MKSVLLGQVILVVALVAAASSRAGAEPYTAQYGNLTLNPTFSGTNWGNVWDLTAGDLKLSYQLDLRGVTKTGSWTEVGIRQQGEANFNPGPSNTYQGGAGGWMTSTATRFTPSEGTQALHDKHNLSASGGRGEGDYDATAPGMVGAPFGSGNNYGIWFDRDSVDSWQADAPGAVNGGTYNTNGVYA